MRRGLMGWNEDELPLATLSARTARLQDAMAQADMGALLIYTNLVRPSAVSWLTGFTPYWSEGLLLVGRSGEPAFATALSKRVANWIRSVSPAGEIVNTPRPGVALGKRVADMGVGRVGILEMDAFPAGAYDDFAAVAPGAELMDATTLFAEVRRGTDAAERSLVARADAIAAAALERVDRAHATEPGAVAAAIERHARRAGAEEIYIGIAPDLASDSRMVSPARASALRERFAVRVSVAYKGCWIRRTRTFAKDAGSDAAQFDAWLAGLVGSLAPGRPLHEQIAAAVHALNGATLKSWMAETCRGSYPLQVVASSRGAGDDVPAAADFLVLTIELTIDGAPWIGAAPAIVP